MLQMAVLYSIPKEEWSNLRVEGKPRFINNGASDQEDKGRHGKGGAVYTEGPIQIKNAQFADNKAVSGSSIWSEGNLIDTGSLYYMNEASASGTILLKQSTKKYRVSITLNDLTFLKNTAGQSAGCIWNEGKLTINGGRFLDNSALNGVGGAIRCSSQDDSAMSPEMCINRAEISHNAAAKGGAIYSVQRKDKPVMPKWIQYT
jgi:hypothetical protein